MAAKMSVLGLILSSYPYLRSAMVWFPLAHMHNCVMVIRSYAQLYDGNLITQLIYTFEQLCKGTYLYWQYVHWTYEHIVTYSLKHVFNGIKLIWLHSHFNHLVQPTHLVRRRLCHIYDIVVRHLKSTACYAGYLLAPAKGFGFGKKKENVSTRIG